MTVYEQKGIEIQQHGRCHVRFKSLGRVPAAIVLPVTFIHANEPGALRYEIKGYAE
jgi:hypothetical protein